MSMLDLQASLSLRSQRVLILCSVMVSLTSIFAFAEGADRLTSAPSLTTNPSSVSPMGRPLDPSSLNALTPNIYPNGKGLPVGMGFAKQGAALYQSQCASCHGRKGEGGTAQELIGGEGPLSAPDADKTLLTYWPYATTLFDTILRSMPPAAPGHLSADEIYALCAYLLAQNGLWNADQPMGAKELTAITMPNRNGFIRKFP